MKAVHAIMISCSIVMVGSSAHAHPLPSFQFDRIGVVRVTDRTIEIDYRLELSLFAMALDSRGLLTRDEEQRIGGRQKEFSKTYGEKKAPLIADALRVSLNQVDLTFQSQLISVEFEETHAKFHFRFTAEKSQTASPTSLKFEDQSFEDKPGVIDWSFQNLSSLSNVVQPIALRGKSPLEITAEQSALRRKLSATIEPIQKSTKETSVALPEFEEKSESEPGLFASLMNRGLVALFDSTAGIGVLLLAAAGFGMAHAVTPGHGKTLVAAYLVGEKGTIGHAFVLGLSTTIAHTGSVIVVAAVLSYSYRDGVPESARAWLELIGGLLILFVGFWLFVQRFRGRADHVHLTSGSSKDKKKPFGWLRVILLGLAGGMIPCWDAVLLLLVAITAGRLGFALPLLIAFSIGLSAVLVALGIGVVLATRAGGRSFGESRWFQWLPIVSAIFLVLVGLWFVRESFHMFEEAESKSHAAVKG